MKKALKIIIAVILVIIAVFGLILLVGTIKEWKPADVEKAEVFKTTEKQGKDAEENSFKVSEGKDYSILTFNVGYGGLGEEEDFFMDGGTRVMAESKEEVEKNLKGIKKTIKDENADFTCIQEADRGAKRSFKIDQKKYFDKALNQNSAYADNFKVWYVPYPLPVTTGHVRAGLYTASRKEFSDAERISLPVPFKWPVRIFNLKRCLLVTRFPIEGTDKEFVLVNMHLEAYDDGGGKAAQTKALMEFSEKEYKKGNYVIACGDWNQAFETDDKLLKLPKDDDLWKPTMIERSGKHDDWQLKYDATVPSCRLDNQPYTIQDENTYHYLIDGYLVSPNIKVKNVETLDRGFKHSDHNPVKLQFEIPEK